MALKVERLPLAPVRAAPGKTTAAVYRTAEYRRWAGAVKARDGFACRDCGSRRSLIADHVIEIEDGGAPFDVENGLTRCAACHGRKTAAARLARWA